MNMIPFQSGYLSNWFDAQFTDKYGKKFHHIEQYMMFQKAMICGDQETASHILVSFSPKQFERKVKNYSDKLWHPVREKVMVEGLLMKFRQNPDLKHKLLQTEKSILIKASPRDRIWGVGLDIKDPAIFDPSQWKGTNLLGKSLMETRRILLKEENDKTEEDKDEELLVRKRKRQCVKSKTKKNRRTLKSICRM